MTRKARDERGSVSVMTIFACVVLAGALCLACDLSVGLAARTQVSNDMAAARDATMSPDVLLVAKNSDDPGRVLADAAVETLRANGFSGEVEFWFWEAPSSQLSTGKRAWAWAVQGEKGSPAIFARIFQGEDFKVGDFVVAHAVPFTAGQAWRPATERMGKWVYPEGQGAGTGSFEPAASKDEIPAEVAGEVDAAVRESREM